MHQERTTYSYKWRLRGVQSSPDKVMQLFRANPSKAFAFRIRDEDGNKAPIQEGKRYNIFPMLVRRDPLMVDYQDDTSFRFLSLPGHFHGPGSTITFTVFENPQGELYLQHYAEIKKQWHTPFIIFGAGIYWFAQSRRLAHQARKHSG